MPALSSPEKALEIISQKTDEDFGVMGMKDYLCSLINRDICMKVGGVHPDSYICPSCFFVNKNVIGNLVLDDFCPVCGQRISN